jgi:hypothetical protein
MGHDLTNIGSTKDIVTVAITPAEDSRMTPSNNTTPSAEVRVDSDRRDPPDVNKLAKLLIDLVARQTMWQGPLLVGLIC